MAYIVDLRAWLTTVTSRVCLDMHRTRRTRREVPIEIDMDELLAGHARRRVRVVPGTTGSGEADDRAVVDAFFAAAGSGDLSALLAVLAPNAELHAFSPRGVRVVQGADKIAARARAGARAGLGSGAVLRPVTVRGAAGMLVLLDDRPISVIAFTVRQTRSRCAGEPPTATSAMRRHSGALRSAQIESAGGGSERRVRT